MIRKYLTVVTVLALASCAPAPQSYDVLIINGTVYDGSPGPARMVNIGISGDRIASMDADPAAESGILIDAAGLVVAPGFIDPHTHAEDDIFDIPGNHNLNFLAQGVSTVFIGNDGGTIADRVGQLETLRTRGVGTSIGWFSGHNTAREAVLGLENRAPSED